MVKACLKLVGDNQKAVLVALEGFRRLTLRDTIHIAFGILKAIFVLDGAREGNKSFVWIVMLLQVGVYALFVKNGV